MKTFSILITLALTFAQIHGQKQQKVSNVAAFQNEDFNLNKGEFFGSPEDKFNEELKGYEDNFGHKINQKTPFKSQIQNGPSHYESLRPDTVQQPVKTYVMKKPETFLQDIKGMKFTTSVGKPKKMKAKVVQKGSVKHIYLDIPDSEPLPQSSMPKGIRYTSPSYHQFEGGNNYFHKQPSQHQSFSQQGFNNYGGNYGSQQSFGYDHGFGGVSSGFRVGKAQFQPSKGLGAYGSQFGSGTKYPPPQYNRFKPISPPAHSLGNNFNHVLHQYAAPQQNYQHGTFGGNQFGQANNFDASSYQALAQGEHKHQFGSEHPHQFGGEQQHQFGGEQYQFGSDQLQQFGGEQHQFGGEQQHQFGSEQQHQFGGEASLAGFGGSHNFPQFSQDGKEKFRYEIPKEYQHLFAGQGGHGALTEQPTNQVPKVVSNFGLDQTQHQQPQQEKLQFDFGKDTNPFETQIQQAQQQQLQFDFTKGSSEYDLPKQQQFQYDFKGSEYLPKAANLYSTQAQQFNTGKGNEQVNIQQNEFLPQPSQLVQFPQPQQFEQFKQSESIGNQNFGEQYNTQQYSSGSFEASKPITEYGQSNDFIPKVAPNYQFNQQQLQHQLESQQKTPGLENVSGFDPDLVNIVNKVINKGEGIPTNNGFKIVKSNENNAIYLVGKPGMSLDSAPNFGGFKPSDFQLNNGNSEGKPSDPNNGTA